jgi:putative redox protein
MSRRSSERVEFANSTGQTLVGRFEAPQEAPVGVAIFAHCFTCSKDIAAATRISRALCQRGFAVLRFDFTGLGNSEGDFAQTDFSSNVGDLVAAAAYLRGRHLPPALLVGHSLGGAAVLMAAPRIPEVRAIATIAAPSEPRHVRKLLEDDVAAIEARGVATVHLGGRRFQVGKKLLDDLDAQRMGELLRRLHHATLIFHSPVDNVVGIDHARRIYEAVQHPKSFVSLDDADHLLTRPADSEYVAEVLAAWASRYVARKPKAAAAAPETGTVVVEELSGLTQAIRAGRHLLYADEPASVPGGADRGPDPYQLLLASLGACTSMTVRMYAGRKGWPLTGVRVQLKHERVHPADCATCEGQSAQVDRIERVLALDGPLDAAQRERLLEIANRCPVHRTLLSEKEIATRLAP